MINNKNCFKVLYIGYFLLIVILFYLYYKKKNIEKMTNQKSINDLIKEIYDLDVVPINRLSNLIKEREVDITGNVIIRDEILNTFPSGSIILFNNKIKNKTIPIPKGWVACEGQEDNIPDLRDRMVLGEGNKSRPKIAGEKVHTITNDELPKHTHVYTNIIQTINEQKRSATTNFTFCPADKEAIYKIENKKDKLTPKIKSGGGSDNVKPHNNMPPYYTLIWIYKL